MPKGNTNAIYKMTSKVLVYPGMGGWRFLALSKKHSQEIKEKFGAHAKAWGSLPVSVTLGKTTWNTSIFPDKKSRTYLLPLKAEVRKKENVTNDNILKFLIEIKLK